MLEKQLLLFGKEFASEPEEEASCLLHSPTCDSVVMTFSPSEPEEEASCLLHIPTCDSVVMAFSPSEPEEEASCLS